MGKGAGYAGYVPAKLPPSKASLKQQALWAMSTASSYEVLEKLSYNVAVQPGEPKWRTVKLSNPKIHAAIVEANAVPAMLQMGWVEAQSKDGQPTLQLPPGASLTMADVREVQEAAKRFAKNAKDAKRSEDKAKLPGTTEAAELRAALEADRRERASQGPVTKGSTAQALPGGEGLNITTAKDIGIGSDGCDC